MIPLFCFLLRNYFPFYAKLSISFLIRCANIFTSISALGILKTLAEKLIIFAMANQSPDMFPDKNRIKAVGTYLVCTEKCS
jgi:hypothetical protein